MSLPVRLSPGLVSIYGNGSIQGIFSTENTSKIRFGIVDQRYDEFSTVALGDSVMYNIDDVKAPVFYIDTAFYILPEDKIISVENPIIPPP